MQKIILFAHLILIVCCSCKKYEDNPTLGFVRKNKIIGNWILEKVLIDGVDSTSKVRSVHGDASLTINIYKTKKGSGDKPYSYIYTTNSQLTSRYFKILGQFDLYGKFDGTFEKNSIELFPLYSTIPSDSISGISASQLLFPIFLDSQDMWKIIRLYKDEFVIRKIDTRKSVEVYFKEIK